MPDPSPRVRRDVVSYVRRSSRMNPSQASLWDRHAHRMVVDIPARETSTSVAPDAVVDWDAAFGRRAPLAVEIGPGRGESTAALAAAHPDWNIVAFEVHVPSAAQLMGHVDRAGVSNVRVAIADAAEGLRVLFDADTLAEVWTFFPDPWHKARHHKRRLISPEFARIVAERLAPGSRWRLATDWPEYAQAMVEVLDAEPLLRNEHAGAAPRYAVRPLTKYEARGANAGRPITDLTYRRV